MPSITSRACGICPVSHLLASAKACDEIVAVNVPRTAVLLRRLMHMGQMIQSHALNFFHLSAPDFLLGMDADPATRNVFGLIEKQPELARQGIRLRKFGQEIIENVAGKKIHSSEWIVPGGAKWPLTKERADYLKSNLHEALATTSADNYDVQELVFQLHRRSRDIRRLPILLSRLSYGGWWVGNVRWQHTRC